MYIEYEKLKDNILKYRDDIAGNIYDTIFEVNNIKFTSSGISDFIEEDDHYWFRLFINGHENDFNSIRIRIQIRFIIYKHDDDIEVNIVLTDDYDTSHEKTFEFFMLIKPNNELVICDNPVQYKCYLDYRKPIDEAFEYVLGLVQNYQPKEVDEED